MKEESSQLPLNNNNTHLMDDGSLTETNIDTMTILESLFSKTFLGNLKNELSKKGQPSSLIHIPIKKESPQTRQQKQIELMSRTIKELRDENKSLKEEISHLCVGMPKSLGTLTTSSASRRTSIFKRDKLQIISQTISHTLQSKQSSYLVSELQRLQEKIAHLEMHKSVKQQRVNQLLEKDARRDSQLRLLKIKENNLQSEVKNLKESIKVHFSDIDAKPLAQTNISQIEFQLPKIEEGAQYFTPDRRKSFLDKCGNFLKLKDDSILASNCQAVEVPEELHISKLCLRNTHLRQQARRIEQEHQKAMQQFEQGGVMCKQVAEEALDLRRVKGKMDQSQIIIDLSQGYGLGQENTARYQIEQSLVEISMIKQTNQCRQSIIAIDI